MNDNNEVFHAHFESNKIHFNRFCPLIKLDDLNVHI